MIVVASPPGSGKSSAFPLAHFGVDYFNVDDVTAELNAGRYVNMSSKIRQQANQACEAFISDHIRDGTSFAVETTLRTYITFKQAHRARRQGFLLIMFYVAVGSAREAIKRVAARAEAGGHSAPVKVLRETYHLSLGHLPVAIRQFDHVLVFDNTPLDAEPTLVLEASTGAMYFITTPRPRWLKAVIDTVVHRRD